MRARVLNSDDSEPVKRQPPDQGPLRKFPGNEALHRSDPVRPCPAPADAVEPPRLSAAKPWRRRTFEGDDAAIELRSRLAEARNGKLAPHASVIPPAGAVLRFAGLVMAAAVTAGAVGYVVGVRLPFKPPAWPAVAATSAADTAPVVLAAHHQAPNRAMPAQVVEVDGGAQRLAAPLPDGSDIAARLKIGADLMAAGDIAAARTMFARVAEAGDAAGAFALAETYDPVVLGTMRLRGGITADVGLARQWYEKAKDMGSGAAPDRIARLAPR